MHYRDLTSFNINYFELIIFDYNFILERSETSDSRPHTNSDIISEPSLNEYNLNILQHDTGQNTLHFNKDDTTELFQNQEPQQFNIIPDPQHVTTTLQNVPDPSETATKQNISELSDETVNNTQSFTITNASNILNIPLRDITPDPIRDQTQNDTTHNTNQDNTSILSTSNSNITQEFQTQQTSPRNFDPPCNTPRNPSDTQHSTTNNNQLNTLNPFSISQPSNSTRNMLQKTQFQTSNPPSTAIRTNPHIKTTYTQPFTNTSNISSNVSNILTYKKVPPSTISQ